MSDKALEYYADHPLPEEISFEDAIALTQKLLANDEPPDATIQSIIPKLLKTKNGARGFFVTFLTHQNSLADDPSPALITALRSEADTVAELMVKNLAMSSAMTVMHQRQENLRNLEGSRHVQERSSLLIQRLDLAEISEKLLALWAALRGEGNQYAAFLDKWNYDTEQRAEIHRAIEPLVTSLNS